MSTTTVHQRRNRSKRTTHRSGVFQSTTEPAIAAPATLATAQDLEQVWAELEAFLESDDELAERLRKPEQREALRWLVAVPYEVATVGDACRRVAAILDLLANSTDIVHTAFEAATQAAERRAAMRPA